MGLLLTDFLALLAEFGPREPGLHLMFLFYPLSAFMRLLKRVFFCTTEEFEPVLQGTGTRGSLIGRIFPKDEFPTKVNLNGMVEVVWFNGANQSESLKRLPLERL